MDGEDSAGPVLVAGATGAVGAKVVRALLERGKPVRALVRPGSDATHIEREGVTIARGDMMDPPSLDAAMAGVDAVISSAAGYTGRRKTDSADIDTIGNRNLAEAAKRAGVRRFVLTSILACDEAASVPHFWHKHLAERALHEAGVPYVSLRPGAFLDQSVDMFADGVRKGWIPALGARNVPWTWVYTPDLARYLALAVDLDASWDGRHVDIGWDRALTTDELAQILARLSGRKVSVRGLPWPLIAAVGGLVGLFSGAVQDMVAMMRFFRSGAYVADTSLQAEAFGVPTAEEAVAAWLRQHDLLASAAAA